MKLRTFSFYTSSYARRRIGHGPYTPVVLQYRCIQQGYSQCLCLALALKKENKPSAKNTKKLPLGPKRPRLVQNKFIPAIMKCKDKSMADKGRGRQPTKT